MKIKMVVLISIVLFLFGSIVSAGFTKKTNPEDNIDGYILFSPNGSTKTFLMNQDGKIVHTWKHKNIVSLPVYLLENGNLLRGCARNLRFSSLFNLMNCMQGKVEMLNWDGDLIWEYTYSDSIHCLHNDIEPLPNGNILMASWEYKTRSQAIQAGLNESSLRFCGGLLIDTIIEVEPIYPKGGNIVWRWSAWDHLIQDIDPEKDNYGIVADHPELININAIEKDELDTTRGPLPAHFSIDFMHMNGIDYNEKFDQIVVSIRHLGEIWILDHNTTTEEAAGQSGGRYGRGGDLLYRWGNPRVYGAGGREDQQLFKQHDARWITEGCPGEGHITIFNNGVNRPDIKYSEIVEIVPPVDSEGNYTFGGNGSYGPSEPVWSYSSVKKLDFFSEIMSGAQRLPNGNTLVASGTQSKFFMVSSDKEIVWEYFNRRPLPITPFNNIFKIQYYPLDYPGIAQL